MSLEVVAAIIFFENKILVTQRLSLQLALILVINYWKETI